MRVNKYLALATDLSRRQADDAIDDGRVLINGELAQMGTLIGPADIVTLDSQPVKPPTTYTTIMLHKPVGYVCSRDGQGSPTIYELLPSDLLHLNPVGRLDKDSSGILLMTNDGALAHRLTHPSYQKDKVYVVTLDKPLSPRDASTIGDTGVELDDGPSRLRLKTTVHNRSLQVTMSEGRNRQIRRTFEKLGYKVTALHRLQFSTFKLGSLPVSHYKLVANI